MHFHKNVILSKTNETLKKMINIIVTGIFYRREIVKFKIQI